MDEQRNEKDWVRPAFAARLRASLKEHDMTVEDFARAIDAKLRTAQRWVAGRNSPRLEDYAAAQRLFGWVEPLEPLPPDSLGMEDETGTGYFQPSPSDLRILTASADVMSGNDQDYALSRAA